MKKDIKETITAEIITMIENAQASNSDWTMPFKSLGGKPSNALTGKAYRGLNSLWPAWIPHGCNIQAVARAWLSGTERL